jgi:hypothetical protein
MNELKTTKKQMIDLFLMSVKRDIDLWKGKNTFFTSPVYNNYFFSLEQGIFLLKMKIQVIQKEWS